MVIPPDEYTLRKCFLVALREPLHHEVLMRGLTAEFSNITELTREASQVEDAMCYDLVMHQDLQSSSNAALLKSVAPVAWTDNLP